MRRFFISLCLGVLTVSSGFGFDGPSASTVGQIREIRELSQLPYYKAESTPLNRRVYLSPNGTLSINSAYRPFIEFKPPTTEDRQRAITALRGFIDPLKDAPSKVKSEPAPLFSFLTWHSGNWYYYGYPPFNLKDVDAALAAYNEKPSSVLAVAYVELALLERELGLASEFRNTLDEAIETLKLCYADFTNDIEFRKSLPEEVNFGRPESCILYLAGECARQDGKNVEAINFYSSVIAIDPAGPYSWESYVRLMLVTDVDSAVLRQSKKSILRGFPSAWGCVSLYQRSRPMKYEQLFDELPIIAARLAREIRDAEQQKNEEPHQERKN